MNFDGLRGEEIFGRLFGFFFGPQFVAFILAYFARLIPAQPWTSLATALGLVLVIAAIAFDSMRARIQPTWIVIGAVPFVGWALYAWRRGTRPMGRELVARGNWAAVLNPLSSDRYVWVTSLTPDECASRLRARTMRLSSPGSWFARSASVPFQGRVSARRFGLKIRHVMTRPMMLDEAQGKFTPLIDGTTRIDMRVGLNTFDRVFAGLWLAFLLAASIPLIATDRAGWSGAGLLFIFAIFTLVTLAVRMIGRDDRSRLRQLLADSLEARAAPESSEKALPLTRP